METQIFHHGKNIIFKKSSKPPISCQQRESIPGSISLSFTLNPKPGASCSVCLLPLFVQASEARPAEGPRRKSKTMSGSNGDHSLWLAASRSKRWGELFFLAYSPFWITALLGVVVPLRLYERFGEMEYLILGLATVAPCIIFPLLFGGTEDAKQPWYQRYWFKANLWIAIFGFVGNYFWTHYFYVVLGATYSFPSYKINYVPITTFLLTQPYFLLYHSISNITLRRLGHAIKHVPDRFSRWLIQASWVGVLAYLTALAEAVTIANFPYYEMVDRMAMYKVGSLFYAIYFFVSFPMFFRMDENPKAPWTLSQVSVDALGASMLVTIILDLWRISVGPIVVIPWAASHNQCIQYGPPWLRATTGPSAAKQLDSDLIAFAVGKDQSELEL